MRLELNRKICDSTQRIVVSYDSKGRRKKEKRAKRDGIPLLRRRSPLLPSLFLSFPLLSSPFLSFPLLASLFFLDCPLLYYFYFKKLLYFFRFCLLYRATNLPYFTLSYETVSAFSFNSFVSFRLCFIFFNFFTIFFFN